MIIQINEITGTNKGQGKMGEWVKKEFVADIIRCPEDATKEGTHDTFVNFKTEDHGNVQEGHTYRGFLIPAKDPKWAPQFKIIEEIIDYTEEMDGVVTEAERKSTYKGSGGSGGRPGTRTDPKTMIKCNVLNNATNIVCAMVKISDPSSDGSPGDDKVLFGAKTTTITALMKTWIGFFENQFKA